MDTDHPMDYQDVDPFSSQCTTNNSQAWPLPDGDVVTWQSSQSCPVLASLMTQTSPRHEFRPKLLHLSGPLWDSTATPSPTFSTPSWPVSRSSSSAPVRSKTRPPGLRSNRVSNTCRRSSTSTSTVSTSNGGYSELLALIHDVSAQVNDNTQRKTKFLSRQRATAPNLINSKTKSLKENRRSPSTSNSPTNIFPGTGRDGVPVVNHRTRSTVNTSSMSEDGEALVGGDTSFCMQADTDPRPSSAPHSTQASTPPPLPPLPPPPPPPPPNTSARHSTLQAEPIQSCMPPPPLPLPKPSFHTQDQSRNRSLSRPVPAPSSSSNTPPLKVHPLLLNRPPSQPQLQPQLQLKPIKPVDHPPRLSQPSSSRPPVLGMRRTLSTSSTFFSPFQNPPDKRKGFKPPLARPPPKSSQARGGGGGGSSSSSSTLATTGHQAYRPEMKPKRSIPNISDTVTSTTAPNPNVKPVYPRRSSANVTENLGPANHRSSSPAAEADSSFGDMSFDMDALEETMRQYD